MQQEGTGVASQSAGGKRNPLRVAFVREIVPRQAIAQVANTFFGERYVALPMTHKVIEPTSEGGRIQTEYRWRHRGKWCAVRAECGGHPAVPPADSAESFFIEHY